MRRVVLPALALLLLLVPPAAAQDPEPEPEPQAPPPSCESQANAALAHVATARQALDRLRAETLRDLVGAPPVNMTADEQRSLLRLLEGMGGHMAGILGPADMADLSSCGAKCPAWQPGSSFLTPRAVGMAADAQAFLAGGGALQAQASLRRIAHGLQDLHGYAHAWLGERVAALRACGGAEPAEGPIGCLAAAAAQDAPACLAAAGEAWRRGQGAHVATLPAAQRLGHVEVDAAKAQASGVAVSWQPRGEPLASVVDLRARGVPLIGALTGVGPAQIRGAGAERTLDGDRTEIAVRDGAYLRVEARCDLVCHVTFAPGVQLQAQAPGRWNWTAGGLRGELEATGQARLNGTWMEVAAGRLALWSRGPSLIAPFPAGWLESPRVLGAAVGVPSAQEHGSFAAGPDVARLRPHAGDDGFTLEMALPRAGCAVAAADARLFEVGGLGTVATGQLSVRLDRGPDSAELPQSDAAALLAGGTGWAFDGGAGDGDAQVQRVLLLACGDAAGSYRLVANTAGERGSPGAGPLVALALLATAALCRRPKSHAP